MARAVTRIVSLCLFPLNLNVTLHTPFKFVNICPPLVLMNVVTNFLSRMARNANLTVPRVWQAHRKSLSLIQVDPLFHCGPNLMTEGWESSVPMVKVHIGIKYIVWNLLLVAPLSIVENLVAQDLLRFRRWNVGTQLGRSQLCAGLAVRISRAVSTLLPCLEGQVWSLGVIHRVNKWQVKMPPWRLGCSQLYAEPVGWISRDRTSLESAVETLFLPCLQGQEWFF